MSSSTRRALRVLETVGQSERPLGVTEIGRRLEVAAGTAFRGLDALERCGYVGRYQASSRYVSGTAVSRLRQSLFARFRLRDICLPYLHQLAFATGETASLTVPLGWYGVRIAAAPGVNEVTSSPPLGEVRTLAEGGASKAILAFLPDERVARFISWAKQHGDPAATPGALDEELRAIRARGFAIEATPFAAGRAALALPVRGPDGVVASIAIEGPVLDAAAPVHVELSRWLEIVGAVEDIVRARPVLFANPFDHLDPDTIVIPSTAR